MNKSENLNIDLSKSKIIFTYIGIIAIIVIIIIPYITNTHSTYYTFFDDGIGRILLNTMNLFLLFLCVYRYFFIYRAFSRKSYVELNDKEIIVRLRKEEVFNIESYKFISARNDFQRITILNDKNEPIFGIPTQFIKKKHKEHYIATINYKYRQKDIVSDGSHN